MIAQKLPEGFAALEPFVEAWAVAGAAHRGRRRLESTEQERSAFFDAAKDLLGPALTRLDQKPLDQFDDREKRLMDIMLTLAHISMAVEVQRDDEPKHARVRQHMKIMRAPSDFGG